MLAGEAFSFALGLLPDMLALIREGLVKWGTRGLCHTTLSAPKSSPAAAG